MISRLALAIFSFAVIATPASAEVPIEMYLKNSAIFRQEGKVRDYMHGIGKGIFWANIIADSQNRAPLFCPPNKLSFDDGMILSVIYNYLDKSKDPPGTPIEMLAVHAMAEAFPCGK